ncbi:ABC transporter permease [Haematobacter missouriensis]|uniref:ABC transporter permease n=1 Tax=Haematobacter missouriensis TaxID=366616 RepID=A0A212ALE3_9RHOB|nr:iron chelate uptake ABC transporter family permease subunit [Haematobacter missouriensis]KFI32444.1 ABC transporter permease [Haematobacter missouriensis]OWJ76485.1 ABC transporter permease [Haematobacter missouriensis]OWJ82243.1 ABC transporter permease [Haematobacter missouriensis]
MTADIGLRARLAAPAWIAALGAGVLVLAILAGVVIGEMPLPVETVAAVLANRLLGAAQSVDAIEAAIIWNYRLPRTLVAAACGAGLALSGVVLQALIRNALADPYLLGVSAGASTGAVAVTILGLGGGAIGLSAGAFGGAALAFLLVAALARAAGGGPAQLVLAGIAGSQLFNALTSFFIAKSANAEQARGIMFWLLGNLSGVRWPDVALAIPVVLLGLIVCVAHVRAMDAFSFGARSAASLGISVRRVNLLLIGATTLMTAVMVSLVGSIGFVGLVIPHAVRFVAGPRHGALVPLSALTGAVFLIAADIVSRMLIPGQVVPIGVVTALVGAPGFALILIRNRRLS